MVPEYNLENFKEWLRENPAERKDLPFWEEFAQWLDHLNFAIPRLTTVVLDEKKVVKVSDYWPTIRKWKLALEQGWKSKVYFKG